MTPRGATRAYHGGVWKHVLSCSPLTVALRVVVVVVVACASPSSQTCDDGRICRPGTQCDDLHATCVTQDQRDQCRDALDGTRCESDVTLGLCDDGVCLPACGDGAAQAGEECDDGNRDTADGCNAVCTLEAPAWREVADPWLARVDHAMAYDANAQALVLFGGATPAPPEGSAGLRDDTWIHFQGRWSRQLPTASPPARARHAMAYDQERGRIVLFGGVGESDALLDDTWEFDGTTWTLVVPAARPPGRFDHAMTYDTDRDRVVMFGGTVDAELPDLALWEFDGTTWSVRTTTGLVDLDPETDGIIGAGLAYDIGRSRLVLYEPGAVWELAYNTSSWSAPGQGATRPVPRIDAAVGYVSEFGVMVVGGRSIDSDLGDTWVWKDAMWRRIDNPLSPSPRYGAALVEANDGVFLVGGSPAQGGVTSAEVWRFAPGAQKWERSPVDTKPPARSFAAMTYDEARGHLVMHGGTDLVSISNDTWTYDGVDWRLVSKGEVRYFHSLAYDAKHARTIMFGGFGANQNLAFGTHLWDGETWTELGSVMQPPPRIDAGLAFDAASGVIVLHGGVGLDGVRLTDTWELDDTTWTEVTNAAGPRDGVMNLTYDPDRRRLVLVEQSTDVWTYTNRTWTRLPTTGVGPAPRASASFVHHPGRHTLLLYGGFDGRIYFSDAFELVDAHWQPVVIAGDTPPATRAPSVGMLPSTRAMIVFGGLSPTIALDRTFEFAYR